MRAQALGDLGRRPEARAIFEPHLETVEPGTWQQAMTTTLAALADGRPGDAIKLHATAMRLLGDTLDSEVGALIQADTITPALAQLGHSAQAATSLAVCELAHREPGWPPRGDFARVLEDARSLLDETQLAIGRHEAPDLGTTGGLRWIADIAARKQIPRSGW